MLSATDQDLTVTTAFQIIDSSVDNEVLFDEACNLSKKIRLQCDNHESAHLEASMESFLSVTCQEHQRKSRSCGRIDTHPIPILAKRIIDLSKSCSHEGSPMLNQECLKQFETILKVLKSKTEDFWYNSQLFESMVTKHSLPLEIVWNLQRIGVMTLNVYMSCKLNEDPMFVEKFPQELVSFCRGSEDTYTRRQNVVSGLSEYLIQKGFGEEKSALKRSAIHISDSIIDGVLDLPLATAETEFLALPTDYLSFQECIPKETLKRFSIHALSCILSSKVDATVSETLRSNTDWQSQHFYKTAKTLYKQLFLPLNCEEVAQILLQSLDQLKINGTLMFMFLSVMHTSFKDAAKVINGYIKAKLSQGLDNSSTAQMSAAFLLACQSAVIGCDGFLSYSEWFETTFGDSSRSLAATRSTFTSLIKYLSSLVPFESAEYLKVHIMKRPAIPPKCRNLYDDYIALAKTRLEDLKVPINDLWKGIYNNPSCSKDAYNKKDVNQAEEDVARAVEAFAKTGKIPTALIEASIFKKPYFIGKFLPALLKPRHLPDEPDVRMKLINEVHSSGKMPASMYSTYLEDCEKEKRTLLEGVFDVDGDDDELEEMTLPPLHQLALRLNKFTEAVSNRSQDKVSECLNLVIERVNSLQEASSVGEVSQGDNIVVDLRNPSSNDLSIKVVSEIMDSVKPLISKWNKLQEVVEDRVWYLKGAERLITGLIKAVPHLGSTLYLYILSRLTSQDVSYTLDMTAVAAVCVFVMASADSMDVTSAACNSLPVRSTYSNIVEAVCEILDLRGEDKLKFMLRFWLDYVNVGLNLLDAKEKEMLECDVIEVDSPLDAGIQLLPVHVIKRLSLLCRRQGLIEGRQQEDRRTDFHDVYPIANSVLSNLRWKSLYEQHQPTVVDLVEFELTVDAQHDCFSSSEREDYLWDVSMSFLERSEHSTDASGFCFEVLRILAQYLVKLSRDFHSVCDEIPKNMTCFIQLLKKHLVKLPSSEVVNKSWLSSALELSTVDPYKDSMLRLALELPPHIMFCYSLSEKITKTHVDSAVAVLNYFCSSRQNRGGYLSELATLFIVKGVVWAQHSSSDVCELQSLVAHSLMTVSVLEHRRTLEIEGLLKELDAGWVSQLVRTLHWAERFLETGKECTVKESVDTCIQGVALFVALLHRNDDFILDSSIIKSEEDVLACALELLLAHMSWAHVLSSDVDSSQEHKFVRAIIHIFSNNSQLLYRLLDMSDTRLSGLRCDLGLERHQRMAYLRDYHILWLAAQVPVCILLAGMCGNVTLAVVNAYLRVLGYTSDREFLQFEVLQENCPSMISTWIKCLIDHTRGNHLNQISVPETRLYEADLLLFRYIEEKKKGWV